jgi:peptidoglycan hydrolase-like protein with peptidoglycan-binding domain
MTRRGKGLAAVAVSALAAGAAGGWALSRPTDSAAETPDTNQAQPTTSVTKQDLVETKDVDGTLGYGEQSKLATAAHGTVTWLPEQGAVVGRGKSLARIDQKPVTLLYGSVPMYRTLSDGDEGADVAQLEKNLSALGYDGFTVDDEYTDGTAEAVERWQVDLGLDETGTVTPAQVVFLPGAIRVADQIAEVGGQAGSALLSYTGTSRTVAIALEVADQQLARKGTKVTVELPSGGTAKGTITDVGRVAELPANDSGNQAGGSNDSDASDATIEVTVTMDDPKACGSLDEAPVTVRLVSEQRKGVLAVPVSALLALKEGGYGVQVVAAGATRIVPVKLGMFADGRVEVSGPGITAGTKVGVPRT